MNKVSWPCHGLVFTPGGVFAQKAAALWTHELGIALADLARLKHSFQLPGINWLIPIYYDSILYSISFIYMLLSPRIDLENSSNVLQKNISTKFHSVGNIPSLSRRHVIIFWILRCPLCNPAPGPTNLELYFLQLMLLCVVVFQLVRAEEPTILNLTHHFHPQSS